MASKFIPSGFTPAAKPNGNNSKPKNKRGKYTRMVLRQTRYSFRAIDGEKIVLVRQTIFHKLRGFTQSNQYLKNLVSALS